MEKSAPGRARTSDLKIFSLTLSQLSYRGGWYILSHFTQVGLP